MTRSLIQSIAKCASVLFLSLNLMACSAPPSSSESRCTERMNESSRNNQVRQYPSHVRGQAALGLPRL